ncbi:MAG: GNAT family N-acetyltransferase [Firmicutes bacterium]|nr:GNAT family N-acetyltransferase [Bacillota bacterium]
MSESDLSVTWERELSQELLATLVEMEIDAFGIGGMNEWFLPAFARHGAVFVLWHRRQPVGVAECMRDWEDPATAYLFAFSIVAGKRGRGWGKVFLREICRRLSEMRIAKLALTVAPENSRALSLYRGAGFQRVKMIPDAYGPGTNRYYLIKTLAEEVKE